MVKFIFSCYSFVVLLSPDRVETGGNPQTNAHVVDGYTQSGVTSFPQCIGNDWHADNPLRSFLSKLISAVATWLLDTLQHIFCLGLILMLSEPRACWCAIISCMHTSRCGS